MRQDIGTGRDEAHIEAALGQHDYARWNVKWQVDKYLGEIDQEALNRGELTPYESVQGHGNILLNGGISCLWECLIGNGTGTSGQALTFFNNGNAHIGVGDSTTAAAAAQTDLQAASNKLRKAMDSTYPQHTDHASNSSAATITFRATFATGDANFSWQEWGIFNASSGQRMLNRKVTDLGTKTSAASWVFTVTITIS
jgi:hypothetical protein